MTATTTRGLCPAAGCIPLAAYYVTLSKPDTPTRTVYFDKFNRALRSQTVGFDGRNILTDTEYDNLGRVKREKVVGNLNLSPGTAIATFKNGQYPQDGTGHAAVYLGQDSKGNLTALDQWVGKSAVTSRTIWNIDSKPFVDNAGNYSIIKW